MCSRTRDRREPGGVLGDPGHPRRGPALGELGVKNVNDLSEAEWGAAARAGSQRLMACRWTPAVTSPTASAQHLRKMFQQQRSYGTNPQTGLLDYDAVAAAREFKP